MSLTKLTQDVRSALSEAKKASKTTKTAASPPAPVPVVIFTKTKPIPEGSFNPGLTGYARKSVEMTRGEKAQVHFIVTPNQKLEKLKVELAANATEEGRDPTQAVNEVLQDIYSEVYNLKLFDIVLDKHGGAECRNSSVREYFDFEMVVDSDWEYAGGENQIHGERYEHSVEHT